MLPRKVIANGLTYTIVDDVTLDFRVLAHGRVIDAITRRALGQPFFMVLDRKDIVVKAQSDGLFYLAGKAEAVFPKHASQPDMIQAVLSARGYVDQPLPVNVPMAVPFPIVLADVELRPEAVVLSGRVTNSAGAPIAGALVTAKDQPAQHALLLRAPLSHPYGSGATVSPVPPSGNTSTLIQTANVGDAVLSMNGTLAATKVQVTDGVNTDQIDVGVLSDANGYYRARGIGGVSSLTLLFDNGATTKTTVYVVNYGAAVNQVDIVL